MHVRKIKGLMDDQKIVSAKDMTLIHSEMLAMELLEQRMAFLSDGLISEHSPQRLETNDDGECGA
jgi:hypothetical protein